jgi:multiple sugar transport system permease protein
MGTVFSNALAAYGFARLRWPGREAFFMVTLATMMIPFPVVMVPLYGLFKSLGWIGTFRPLWVPAFFGSAFNIFLLRQFFRGIPFELSEAATIDGANEWQVFWEVLIPLAKPALAVVALFTFLATWTDFLGPLIYLMDQKTFTLSLGLQFYQSHNGGTEWNLLMAATVIVILPVIILFFFTQKLLIRGIALTGLKG